MKAFHHSKVRTYSIFEVNLPESLFTIKHSLNNYKLLSLPKMFKINSIIINIIKKP